jgi:protein TonB
MEAVQMEVSMSAATEVREPEVQEPVKVWRPSQVPPSWRQTPAGPMFADVLLETDGLQRRRRTLATVVSLVLQCSVLGGLLLVPLMYTETLPRQQLLSFLVAPPPPPPPPPASEAAAKVVRRVESDIADGRLRTPGAIPRKVQMIQEEEAPPALSSGGVIGGVPGGIPGGQLGGVIGGIISSTSVSAVPKLAMPAAPKRMRMSQGVTKGSLIQKIEPTYPPIARDGRIQGQVVLTAIISETGEIQNLVLVSGHPMLVPAAMAAVKQWRYRPFLLNGEPVEVETTITITFQIGG